MTPNERTACDEGVKATIAAARIVVVTIECADDATAFRKCVTAEALAAFAEAVEGWKLAAVSAPSQEASTHSEGL